MAEEFEGLGKSGRYYEDLAAIDDVIKSKERSHQKAQSSLGIYDEAISDLTETKKTTPGVLRGASARALAPVYGQFGAGGMGATAGGAMAGTQAAMVAEEQILSRMSQIDEDLANAKLTRSEAELMVEQLAGDLATARLDRPSSDDLIAMHSKEIQAQWQSIKNANQDTWYTFESDVLAKQASEMRGIVDQITEPEIKAYWERKMAAEYGEYWGGDAQGGSSEWYDWFVPFSMGRKALG